MINRIAFVILLFICQRSYSSVLSNLANSLGPHRWGIMPSNAMLGAMTLDYSLLYWNDSGVWDPVKKKIRWVGGPGTCCANPADYKMITYDVEANTWALNSTPFSGSGHAYDANAFNPIDGLHYFALIGSPTVHTWNDTAWKTLPDAPFSSTTPSLTWFPEINGGKGGLVFLGDDGKLAWYDGTKWITLSAVGLSGYNGFSQYNPVEKAVWLGGGGGQANFLLNATLTARRLKDAPFSLANGSTMQTCDPVGGKFLVYAYNTNQWWELNPASDTWSQVTDMTPKFSLANAFHVPIPEYGVILVFNFSTPVKSVYVYKHTATASAAEKNFRPAGAVNGIDIFPNPATRRAAVRIRRFTGSGRAGIYDSRGRLVKLLPPARETRWETGALPAGVYFLRATAGGNYFEKKLILLP